MRPTRILGIAAALVVASLATLAQADQPPPPTVSLSNGTISIAATGNTHLNPGFPWKLKDGTGTTVKTATFNFTGGTSDAPTQASVGGANSGFSIRGGYCQTTGCNTFSATCSGSSGTCTVSTP